jgi:hypothetical protein
LCLRRVYFGRGSHARHRGATIAHPTLFFSSTPKFTFFRISSRKVINNVNALTRRRAIFLFFKNKIRQNVAPAWCQSSGSFYYFYHPAGQINKQIEKIFVCFPSLGAYFESINGQTGRKKWQRCQ